MNKAQLASFILNFVTAFSGVSSLVWLRWVNGLKWTSVFMFTIWSVVAQIMTSCFFMISDAYRFWNTSKSSRSKAVKNGLKNSKKSFGTSNADNYRFLLFHVPLVMVTLTAIMFWIIHSIDPNALVPKDFYYPSLMNHMHHTFPLIFAIAQMCLFAINEINSFNVQIDAITASEMGMPCVFLVECLYAGFIVITSVLRGKWPYPFLNFLTRLQLGILIVGGIVLGLTVSHVLNQITFKVAKSIRARNIVKKIK